MYTPEQLELIMQDETLKAAYKDLLMQDMQVRILDLKTKYNTMVVKEEEKSKPSVLPPEVF